MPTPGRWSPTHSQPPRRVGCRPGSGAAVSGGELDQAIKPELAYDKGEVNHFIDHIGRQRRP